MLSVNGKKILLSVHIILIAIWVGAVAAEIVLLLAKDGSVFNDRVAAWDAALFFISDNIIMNISLAVAVSGILFSMFTHWGFIRFYWIMVKWALILALAGVIMFWAGPAVNGMAALSDTAFHDLFPVQIYAGFESAVIMTAWLQLIILMIIILISVFKPWGARKIKKQPGRGWVIGAGLLAMLCLLAFGLGQYLQLNHFRHIEIQNVELGRMADGFYTGQADYAFPYRVSMKIENHRIMDVTVIDNRESHYAQLAGRIKYKILHEQRIDVAAVTGATTTSKVILKAVEQAAQKALQKNEE